MPYVRPLFRKFQSVTLKRAVSSQERDCLRQAAAALTRHVFGLSGTFAMEFEKAYGRRSVFHLKGVRQRVIVQSFPFVPARLSLFVLFSSPRAGEFPGYVRVVSERTGKAVFYAQLKPRPTFDGSDEVVFTRCRLRCAFPEAGRYSVQVCFFQMHGNDVVKGEIPFSVLDEST